MVQRDIKGIHRVSRKLVKGIRWHFYAWRGGPKFWSDTTKYPTTPDFFVEFAKVAASPKPTKYMTHQMVDDYLSSTKMPKGERTCADYRKWGLRFSQAFKDDPAALFEEPASRGEVNEWRKQWAHSPKQHDYAGTVAVIILNWARDEGKISQHFCDRLHKIYEVDRSDIVWSSSDREAINTIAPDWVKRILNVACETGLRPGDLIKLTAFQIENTPMGQRLRVRTNKRKRLAHIPITPILAEIIASTPVGQDFILGNAHGDKLTEHRASEGLRQWRDKAGLSTELRLQDTRGTAATSLLNAGLSLSEIANHMGWSLRTAAAMIERYARVSPDETDGILIKLAQAKGVKA